MLEKNKRQAVECFSRAMGFYRPVSYFNIGKRAEFEERKTFKQSVIFENIKKLLKKDK